MLKLLHESYKTIYNNLSIKSPQQRAGYHLVKRYAEVPSAYEHAKCIMSGTSQTSISVYAIVQATVQLVVLLHVIGFVADGDEEENQMKL